MVNVNNREAELEEFIRRLFGEGDLAAKCDQNLQFYAKKALGMVEETDATVHQSMTMLAQRYHS